MKKLSGRVSNLFDLVGICTVAGLLTLFVFFLVYIEILYGSVSNPFLRFTCSILEVFGGFLFYIISKIVSLQLHITTKVLVGGIRFRVMRRQKENLKNLMKMLFYKRAIDSKTALSELGTFSLISFVWIEMFHVSFSDWLFRFLYSAFVAFWGLLSHFTSNVVYMCLHTTAKLAILCVLFVYAAAFLVILFDTIKNIFFFRKFSGTMKVPGFQAINVRMIFFFIPSASALKTVPAFVSKFDAIYWFRAEREVFTFEKIFFEVNQMRIIYSSKTATAKAHYNINVPPNPMFTLTNVTHQKRGRAVQNFNNFENMNGFREPFLVQICIKKI